LNKTEQEASLTGATGPVIRYAAGAPEPNKGLRVTAMVLCRGRVLLSATEEPFDALFLLFPYHWTLKWITVYVKREQESNYR